MLATVLALACAAQLPAQLHEAVSTCLCVPVDAGQMLQSAQAGPWPAELSRGLDRARAFEQTSPRKLTEHPAAPVDAAHHGGPPSRTEGLDSDTSRAPHSPAVLPDSTRASPLHEPALSA